MALCPLSSQPRKAEGETGGEFPPLFFGAVEPARIEPYRLCANPGVGLSLTRPDYMPDGWGFSLINDHQDPKVVESFRRDGIKNPVYLWQRWGRLWPRYGGSRCWFAKKAELPSLTAIVADYDDVLGDLDTFERVERDEALSLFDEPPIGHTPHGWYDHQGLEMAIELWRVKHGPR